ncbi:hypothetical protein HaLaN_10687, partial [Haematococcus lacustris]
LSRDNVWIRRDPTTTTITTIANGARKKKGGLQQVFGGSGGRGCPNLGTEWLGLLAGRRHGQPCFA